jgi:N-methylhydantoinase A
MLMSDVRRDYFVTRLLGLRAEEAPRLEELLAEVEGAALEQFAREGIEAGRVRFLRHGNLRYVNQEHGVEVPLPAGRIDAAVVEAIAASFHDLYEREYTYRLDAAVELVGVHLVAVAEVGKLIPEPAAADGRSLESALKGRRDVDFDTEGVHSAAVYDGELLAPGHGFEGPAVVESSGSTTLLHPGNRVEIDRYGNLVISL